MLKFRRHIALLAAALLLSSCIYDEMQEGSQPVPEKPVVQTACEPMSIQLSAVFEGSSTRAADGTNDGNFALATPVTVSVDGANYNYKTAATSVSDPMDCQDAVSPHFPVSGNSVHIVAYYPSSITYDATVQTFTVAHDQSQTTTGTDNYKASDLMVGLPKTDFEDDESPANSLIEGTGFARKVKYTTKTIPLEFEHRMAKIRIKCTTNGATVNKVEMTGIKRSIDFNSSDNTFSNLALATGGPDASANTVIMYDDATGSSANFYCAAVIPTQTLAANTAFITITTASNTPFVYKLPDAYTFASGTQYNFNVNINENEILVTSSITPWGTDDVIGDMTQVETASYTPLTIEAMENNLTVTISNPLSKTVMYSVNGSSRISSNANPITISLPSTGDKVCLYGDNASYATGLGDNQYTHISCDKNYYLYGNIMSLINSSSYGSLKALTATYTFARMFDGDNTYGNTTLHSLTGKPLVLPSTTLQDYCYARLFQYCTALTIPPMLPATTLTEACYYTMFDGCTSLLYAPALPAITATKSCYAGMLRNCTTLTKAPELPATTVGISCYSHMFYGCTGITAAPLLPATTLESSSYWNMFYGCTNLVYIKMLATSIGGNSLTGWVTGVAATGTFVRHTSMTTLPTGDNGIPDNWNVETATE